MATTTAACDIKVRFMTESFSLQVQIMAEVAAEGFTAQSPLLAPVKSPLKLTSFINCTEAGHAPELLAAYSSQKREEQIAR